MKSIFLISIFLVVSVVAFSGPFSAYIKTGELIRDNPDVVEKSHEYKAYKVNGIRITEFATSGGLRCVTAVYNSRVSISCK